MFRRFEAELVLPVGQRASSAMGSVLHGALMERLPADVAEFLHTQNLRPYSQSVHYEKESERTLWRINTLTDEMGAIVEGLLGEAEGIYLRQKGYAISIQNFCCVAEMDDVALADRYFLPDDAPRGAELTFRTTTAFKRDGQYVLLPEIYLIVQSLLARWALYCPQVQIEAEDLAQQLGAACRISQYALRTAGFSVDGHALRGFRGTLSVGFTGTDSVRRILAMLMEFAPYAGVGIKTALGMGAVDADVWKRR